MAIYGVFLISRQGKTRLSKFYNWTTGLKERKKIVAEVTNEVLSRKGKMCNFIEWRDKKIVYRRYASLYFASVIGTGENELLSLEIIHRFVETLDMYFGNVCELDLIFNFHKAYHILDEFLIGGFLQESNKRLVSAVTTRQDELVDEANEQNQGALGQFMGAGQT